MLAGRLRERIRGFHELPMHLAIATFVDGHGGQPRQRRKRHLIERSIDELAAAWLAQAGPRICLSAAAAVRLGTGLGSSVPAFAHIKVLERLRAPWCRSFRLAEPPRRDVWRPGLDFRMVQTTYSIKRLMDTAFGASVRVRLSATL